MSVIGNPILDGIGKDALPGVAVAFQACVPGFHHAASVKTLDIFQQNVCWLGIDLVEQTYNALETVASLVVHVTYFGIERIGSKGLAGR